MYNEATWLLELVGEEKFHFIFMMIISITSHN